MQYIIKSVEHESIFRTLVWGCKFYNKTLDFSRVIHLNWLARTWIKGPSGIGVARGGPGGPGPPNQNTTNDKKLWQHSLAMFSCSLFSVITHITVINNNINDNKWVLRPPLTTRGPLLTTRGPWNP